MSFNLVESVKAVLNGEVTNKMAGVLGESGANLHQALQAAIPTILTGVLFKIDSGNLRDTMKMATHAAWQDTPFNQPTQRAGSEKVPDADFLSGLFGEKTPDISAAIAEYAGVSSQSAMSLLHVAAPATLAVLGKHILSSNMNANGLRSFMHGQKRRILDKLPAGIFTEGSMNTGNITRIRRRFYRNDNILSHTEKKANWVLPLVILGIGAAAVWYFTREPGNLKNQVLPVQDSIEVVKDTPQVKVTPDVPKEFTVRLPDGTALVAKKGGIEDQLVNFFSDPNSKPSRRFPYNFDQLSFNSGSAFFSGDSRLQIHNVALILKAFPKAKIKIGGFNERGGDSVFNQSLTKNRVAAVSHALKADGVNPSQIEGAEGFGSDFAKFAPDAADSLKEKDRRIAISIRGK